MNTQEVRRSEVAAYQGDRLFMHHGILGERGRAHEVKHRLAVYCEARLAVGLHDALP